MKKSLKKLQLERETLIRLENGQLDGLAGAGKLGTQPEETCGCN